jgi:hypothetical protein
LTLLELHADLTETNRQLKRIADVLERAVPLTPEERLRTHRGEHPLIGRADVSTMTPAHAAEVDAKRANMPVNVRSGFGADTSSAGVRTAGEGPALSRSGEWDHDDPLDDYPELNHEWDNYSGVDR